MKNICNICGANYEYKDGKWVCPACGAYKEEELSNEEVTLLYNAAQKLRLNSFDDAEEMYRDIVRKYPENSEGYWGLVLSKYGIKYEEDYDGKMIPTCYAASYESVLNDKNYIRALESASSDKRKYYEEQGNRIEVIRKEWVEKASLEPPYDIFISYKDTELENGIERTKDSYDAYELYTNLTSLGYRVFYSRESLKEHLGENGEPYIFNALNTAHVMIIFGSKTEYIESTWIRNEWSRFYKRIKAGLKQPNSLIVVYKGFNPEKLPRPLPSVQSINRESLTCLQDLYAYVARVIKSAKDILPHIERKQIKARNPKKNNAVAKPDTVEITRIKGVTASAVKRQATKKREIGVYSVFKLTANAEKLLKIAYAYLESGNFAEAGKAFDNFLVNNRQNGSALLGKMLAQTGCKNLKQFCSSGITGFYDLQLINDVLSFTEKSAAEEILKTLCNEIIRLYSEKKFSEAKEIYEQICSADNADVNELRESLFKNSIKFINNAELKYFIDAALIYEQDEAAYIDKLHEAFDSCIGGRAFSTAQEYHKKLLEYDAANLKTQIGELQLKFKATDFEEVLACCERDGGFVTIENVLGEVDAEGVNELLLAFASRCVKCLKQKSFNFALAWCSLFSKYQFDERQARLKEIADKCIETPYNEAEGLFIKVISALSEGDAKRYADYYYLLAKSARKNGRFKFAIHCYEKAIKYGGDDLRYYAGKFYAELKYDSNKKIEDCISNLINAKTLETILALYKNDKDRMGFLEWLILACIDCVKGTETEQKRVFAVFEDLLAYVPNDYTEKLISFVNEMAQNCLIKGLYQFAERYFAMSVGLNADDHTAYWGLLKAKLKCQTDDGLIKQNEVISEFQEFQNALLASASNSAAMSHYIDVQNEQAAYLKEQELKGVKAKKRNKIIKIASIVTGVAVAFVGAAAGTLAWFNSENRLKYEEVDGGYAVYSGKFFKNSVVGDYEIPSSYNGKPIVEISENAFRDFDKITSFKIPYSVTKIADGAFEDCNNLRLVSFTQTENAKAVKTSELTEIGARAFYNCESLSTFDIPYGVTTIGDEAFAKTALDKVNIPNTVTYMGASVFKKCWNLDSITVQDVVSIHTEWNSEWHESCNAQVEFSLRVKLSANGGTLSQTEQYVIYNKDFRMPVPTQAGYTFEGWYRYDTKMTDEKGFSVKEWIFTDGGTVTANWTANENKIIFDGNGATGGSMYEQKINTYDSAAILPNQFVRDGYTFTGWATSVGGNVSYSDEAIYTMGPNPTYRLYAVWEANENTLTFDGNGATSGSMSEQKIKTDATVKLNDNSFSRKGYDFAGWSTRPDGTVVYIDNATYKMGTDSSYTLYAVWEPTEYNGTYLDLKYSGKNEIIIEKYVGNNQIIEIPEYIDDKPVTGIGDRAFQDCKTITSIKMPNTIKSIGNSAFKDCDSLASLTIPESVTRIGEYAFSYCHYLVEIFYNAKKCSDLTADSNVFEMTGRFGEGTTVTIGASVEKLPAYLFNCGLYPLKIMSVIFAEDSNCTIIGEHAFDNCTLKYLNIPESVKNIGDYAFFSCDELTSIAIGAGVVNIGEGVFEDCRQLTSVIIPDNVINIGNRAFNACKNLISVTIGKGVTNIGNYVFYGCESLSNVIFVNLNGWWMASSPDSTNDRLYISVEDSAYNAKVFINSYWEYWGRS